MKRNLIVVVLLFVSSVVLAEPIYLECEATLDDGEKYAFSVKLDEDTGKITHTSDDGSAFNAEGFFAPNKITYKEVMIYEGMQVSRQFEIDRTTLAIHRYWEAKVVDPQFADVMEPVTSNSDGTCEVVEISSRKI